MEKASTDWDMESARFIAKQHNLSGLDKRVYCRLMVSRFSHTHPGYWEEWAERFAKGGVWGKADEDTRRVIQDIVLDEIEKM